MNHLCLQGTHYQAGFQWGARLRAEGRLILDWVPFAVTPVRRAYAEACVPIYNQYNPSILEEVQGLADGQGCNPAGLRAVLFSMYAMPPACQCSCFALADGEDILLGRNSDFLTALEGENSNVIYAPSDGGYPFMGHTTSFIQMEDGVNACGLAAGLTSVYPEGARPGFNAGLLVRYLLEHCRTVPEALACLRRLPVGSAQTITLADRAGKIAVVECSGGRVAAAGPERPDRPFVCATNRFHLPGMEGENVPGVDDWSAEKRYRTMQAALSGGWPHPALPFAEKLLAGGYGFLCQYDRGTGRDTVWSVVYDLKRGRVRRSEGNPARCGFREDRRFKLG